ncbi:XTP/dITP diphosphatase [Butyrivibrio sp. YAB3001]|uniref:XTP/dITP diphosphatase n=1 Tax=Butyrivibrio sp. YAB3001 TaxID=1520812 RepID=UPI0008F61BCC|nr:XTP/dITP diphosphatase [Butyrivibrio sp. YAB3001]SFB87112.1 XTP/dITP diphosphohydrolase [Butyrivibrio sp. YAB3001]
MRIVFATGNKNKLKEIRKILGDLGMEILSMADVSVNDDIEENGSSFAENSLIKAKAVSERLKALNPQDDSIVLADDSGLEIDYLNGEPGIYSARYMGHDTPYSEKNAAIIKRLEGVPDEKRTARFVCAISAVLPDGREKTTCGTMEGIIGYEIAGNNGFGYDPIFFLPEYGKTSAEISEDEKNAISHRGKALREMEKALREVLK